MTGYRSFDKQPVIVIHPGRMGGQPTIGHSRLPVEDIAALYWHHGLEETLSMYEDLTEVDVVTCCWYMARYGTRTWRARWKDWLEHADYALWSPENNGPASLPPRENSGPAEET